MKTIAMLGALTIAAFAVTGCAKKEMAKPVAPAEMSKPAAETMEDMSAAEMADEATAPSGGDAVAEAGPAQTAEEMAASACLGDGGQLLSWADADGNTVEACRNSEGVEYRLSDAAYFQ